VYTCDNEIYGVLSESIIITTIMLMILRRQSGTESLYSNVHDIISEVMTHSVEVKSITESHTAKL
jgi:hypothetical protein